LPDVGVVPPKLLPCRTVVPSDDAVVGVATPEAVETCGPRPA